MFAKVVSVGQTLHRNILYFELSAGTSGTFFTQNIEFSLLYPWQFLTKVGPFGPAIVIPFIGHIEVTRKEDAYKFDLLNKEYFLKFNFFKLKDYLCNVLADKPSFF